MPLLDLFSFLLRHVEDGKKQQLSGEINRIQEVTLFTARPGPARPGRLAKITLTAGSLSS